MNTKNKIAILGANSYISKDLIKNLINDNYSDLVLFSRNPINLTNVLIKENSTSIRSLGYDQFLKEEYDIIINFVGESDPSKLAIIGKDIFSITDYYDNLALKSLKNNSKCKYIFISSGDAYGDVFNEPVNETTQSKFDLNNLQPYEYYGAAKYLAETRHRNIEEYSIIDVRVFSYFSENINLNGKFLLNEIITSVKNNSVFSTVKNNIWRDYIGPKDFFNFINILIKQAPTNISIDCYSKGPIDKNSMLSIMTQKYGLKIKELSYLEKEEKIDRKAYYFSLNKFANSFGYTPSLSSIELIVQEFEKILNIKL